MQIYAEMPLQLGATWARSDEGAGPGEQPKGFHYHDVEEWLRVVTGRATFISAGGVRYPLAAGQALHLPRGEAHAVEFGPDRFEYEMWVPAGMPPGAWETMLTDEDVALIQTNLKMPRQEDRGDVPFFEGLLSDHLVFRTAGGQALNKERFFLRGFANQNRQPSDTVLVLHKTAEDLVLSNVITLPGPPRQSFTNLRHFLRGKAGAKCLLWVNYPEPGAQDAASRGGVLPPE